MLLRTLPTSLLATACCEDSEESTGSGSQMPLQQIRRVRTLPYTLDLESMDDAGLSQEPQISIEIRDRISAEARQPALLPRRCLTKPPRATERVTECTAVMVVASEPPIKEDPMYHTDAYGPSVDGQPHQLWLK
jgi:hypothetical protein